jgi:hypothetical protein
VDLNPARRKRERGIAAEVKAEFLRGINQTHEVAPPELVAHHFAVVCQRLNIIPTETEAKRILVYVSKELARACREVDKVHEHIFGRPYSG